jgi:hypothetical protein
MIDNFEWTAFRSAHGSAAEVPAMLESTRDSSDSDQVMDTIDLTLPFGLDADVLTEAAAPLAALLLREAELAHGSDRPAWPYLDATMRLLEARRQFGDVVGCVPRETFWVALRWSPGQRVEYAHSQERRWAQISLIVKESAGALRAIAAGGRVTDRTYASASLYLARSLRSEDTLLLCDVFATATDDGQRASLLPCICSVASADTGNDAVPVLVREAMQHGSPYLRAAAWAAWQCNPVGDMATSHLGLDLHALFEASDVQLSHYVWHEGLLAGEFSRAVYLSDLTNPEKGALLGWALQRGFDTLDDLLTPAATAASTASWFYLRLHLAAHYRRFSPVEPAELSDGQRKAVDSLIATSQNWLIAGGDYPRIFGIWDLRLLTTALADGDSLLNRRVGASWPFERGGSTLYGWLSRIRLLPRKSPERIAAVGLLAKALVDELPRSKLDGVVSEIGSFDGPREDLAAAVRAAVAQLGSDLL